MYKFTEVMTKRVSNAPKKVTMVWDQAMAGGGWAPPPRNFFIVLARVEWSASARSIPREYSGGEDGLVRVALDSLVVVEDDMSLLCCSTNALKVFP